VRVGSGVQLRVKFCKAFADKIVSAARGGRPKGGPVSKHIQSPEKTPNKVIQIADHAKRRDAVRQEKADAASLDHEARVLIGISNEIDAIVLRHLQAGDVEPRDLAGLLSHRLGTLMCHIEGKEKLWGVCEKVLKKQAAID